MIGQLNQKCVKSNGQFSKYIVFLVLLSIKSNLTFVDIQDNSLRSFFVDIQHNHGKVGIIFNQRSFAKLYPSQVVQV